MFISIPEIYAYYHVVGVETIGNAEIVSFEMSDTVCTANYTIEMYDGS